MSLSYMLQSSKFLPWQDEYLQGAGMEVYAEKFSSAFYGLAFPVVAEWVRHHLDIDLSSQ